MNKRIEPDLFARLMRLSPGARNDLFEYIGQTPVPPDDVARLAASGVPEALDVFPSCWSAKD